MSFRWQQEPRRGLLLVHPVRKFILSQSFVMHLEQYQHSNGSGIFDPTGVTTGPTTRIFDGDIQAGEQFLYQDIRGGGENGDAL